jgi:excisionase family DNA binding protein
MNELMTVAEAADYLRLSRPTIYRMVQAGELPAAAIRGQVRIRRRDLEALLSHS